MNEQSVAKFETVMIIDDNVIDLYIASRMITKNNFGEKVLMYSKALDALNFLKDNEHTKEVLPQIIFIDIYMPIMSGFEFLTAYNELSDAVKAYSKIYIISSTIDDYDIIRARADANITSFQVKPITKDFLDRII